MRVRNNTASTTMRPNVLYTSLQVQYQQMNKNRFTVRIITGIAIVLLLMGALGTSLIPFTTALAQSVTLQKPLFVEKENIIDQKEIGPNTTKYTFAGNGTINGNIEITDTGDFLSYSKGNDLIFDQGTGLIKIKDGSESANYTFMDVGKGKDFQGAAAYSTNSTGKLSILNNILGIYMGQIGDNGSSELREWHWK